MYFYIAIEVQISVLLQFKIDLCFVLKKENMVSIPTLWKVKWNKGPFWILKKKKKKSQGQCLRHLTEYLLYHGYVYTVRYFFFLQTNQFLSSLTFSFFFFLFFSLLSISVPINRSSWHFASFSTLALYIELSLISIVYIELG